MRRLKNVDYFVNVTGIPVKAERDQLINTAKFVSILQSESVGYV
jgi:hypothetical protein